MDFSAIKTLITQNIRTNNNEDITGNVLQQVLLGMIETLGDDAINDILANVDNIEDIIQDILNGGYGDGVYDISANHGGATYANLAAALGTNGVNVPEGIRKGGMSVKFVQSSGFKYVQYRLMATSWSTSESNWQGVDDEPTAGSENMVYSDGVYKANANILKELSNEVSATIKNLQILADGHFGENPSFKHGVISVTEGEKYVIENFEDSSNELRYAFVTTDTYSAGGIIPVVSGTGIETIPENTAIVTVIPTGCLYLIYNTVNVNSKVFKINSGIKFETGEQLDKVGIDKNVLAGSRRLVQSEAVAESLTELGDYTLEQGNIRSSDGALVNSNKRLRTSGFIKGKCKIKCKPGYLISSITYWNNGVFVEGVAPSTTEYICDSQYDVRVAIKNDSDTTINIEDDCIEYILADSGLQEYLNGKIDNKDCVLKLGQMDIVNNVYITTDGTAVIGESSLRGATSFIPCDGAKTLQYMQVYTRNNTDAAIQGLAFYDADKVFISFVPHVGVGTSGTSRAEMSSVEIPANAKYFRATYFSYGQSKTYGAFYAEITSSNAISNNGKRASTGELVFFSAEVNQSVDQYWEGDSGVVSYPDNINVTNGVLLLPQSYTKKGRKTKVIIYLQGWSHSIYYNHWGDEAGFMPQKQRWADAGYAVMGCNWTLFSYRSGHAGMGSTQYQNAIKSCWQYVKENFNVDEMPYVVGGSAGGLDAINMVYNWNELRACVLLDPWTSIETAAWRSNAAAKSQIAAYYGFEGTSVFEPEKVRGHEPTEHIIDIDGSKMLVTPQIPMKIICLSGKPTDGNHPYYEALLNHPIGGIVSLREVTGITHSELVSGGDGTNPNSVLIDNEVVSWLENF